MPDIEAGQSIDDLGLCEEARLLVGFWLNRAAAQPRRSPSRWMREGIRPGSFWGERVRTTIARQVDRIRHWEIHHCSYEACPVTQPATWFIDPPYQLQGRHYRFGSNALDYADLADWSRNRPGQVIVCENDGAVWLPFRDLAMTKTTRTDRRSHEVYWLNSFVDAEDERVRPAGSSSF
ncbi:MAG TPA: hypothetical protein VGO31_07645 [Microbacteriaceae bacterium]|nr:hypothetical protein [Microbacteriaceae bacterium]